MGTIRWTTWGVAGAAAAGVLCASQRAEAQPIDAFPPLPNVLLLVDTSGSMEYRVDGAVPAVCTNNPVATAAAPLEKSRWTSLVEVLTGHINNRGCYAVDRQSAAFISEFTFGGVTPYDEGYFLPYHRILSNNCTYGPGDLLPNIYQWAATPIRTHEYNAFGTACTTPFDQARDGLLDTYRDRVRFGLFTFDQRNPAGVGVSGTAMAAADGVDGMWSYYPNWWTGTTACDGPGPSNGTSAGIACGHPPNCVIPNQPAEVGARNAAAPPWEGRMINFGPASGAQATTAMVRFQNERIQEGLLAQRPFGATPLAGMMADAVTYFRQDDSNDEVYPGSKFAPFRDDLFNQGCRNSFIIVLSDGEPNIDMRPFCENSGTPNGDCPYKQPYEYASDLCNGDDTCDQDPPSSPPKVKTFAIGFGLSNDSGVDCNTLVPADFVAPAGRCITAATTGLKACCTLAHIAQKGGTGQAYFADDETTLRNAIAAVLDSIAAQSTSRTLPTFVNATATRAAHSNAPAVSYEFASAFTPKAGELWRGNLERKRWACEDDAITGDLVAVLKDVDQSKGDDFVYNVNQDAGSTPRRFLTVVANNGGVSNSTYSIRPGLLANDGMGTYGSNALIVDGDIATVSGAIQSNPTSVNVVPMPAGCSGPDMAAASSADCAGKLMRWNTGGSNGGGLPTRAGNLIGALYHSTPKVMGTPQALTQDPAYAFFQTIPAVNTRPLVLYAQTVDGQLHAFKVASNDSADSEDVDQVKNNEIWSFMPPHVLNGLINMYPNAPDILLDGQMVIRDIPFERDQGQALAGGSASGAAFRTVLVAGGGSGGGFYYALDVTDPYNPEFLWQVSKDSVGAPLFSNVTGMPSIAMIGFRSGGVFKEVAVAILPGGEGTKIPAVDCARQNTDFNHIDIDTTPRYLPRTRVACWQPGPANSFTIVRLQDGKILKTFRKNTVSDGPASVTPALVTQVNIDAPIIGTVPFPNGTGEVSNRIYLNDEDGTMWRVDLSDPDPANWNSTKVSIFFDSYPALGGLADNPLDGQQIGTLPVVSTDSQGNTVVLFSTGDQEDFSSSGLKSRVWSVTEEAVPGGSKNFQVESNWVIKQGPDTTNEDLEPGEKVAGPITVFDEVAYFSTFTPPPAGDVCAVGHGRVWGVRFLDTDPTNGNKESDAALNDPLAPDYKLDLGDDVTPFGVAITAEPSCVEADSATDDYVGKHYVATRSQPPKYVLRFNTGIGGGATGGSAINSAQVSVNQPRVTARVDSWAGVVE